MSERMNLYWNLVDGKITNMSKQTFEVKSPFYPDYTTSVADSNLFDVQVAVSKAKSSYGPCQDMGFEQRRDILNSAGKSLKFGEGDLEYVVKMTGMPIKSVETYLNDIPAVLKTLPDLIEKRIGLYGGRIGRSPLKGSNMFRFLEPIEGITYVVTPGNDPRAVPFVTAWLASLGIPAIFKVSKNDLRIPELVINRIIEEGYPTGGLNILCWDTSKPDKSQLNFNLVDRAKAVWAFGDNATVDQKLRFEHLGSGAEKRIIDHFSDKIVLRHASGRSAGVVDSGINLNKAVDLITDSSMHWPIGCNSMKAVFTVDGVNDELLGKISERMLKMEIGDPMNPQTEVGYINPSDLSLVNERIGALTRMGLLKLVHGGNIQSEFQRSPILAKTEDVNSEFISNEYPAYLLTAKKTDSYDHAIEELNRTSNGKRLSVSVYSTDPDKVLATKIKAHHVKTMGRTTELDLLFHEGQDYLHKLTEPQIHRLS